MTIWANCIVHNEENFIWFSIMSVLDFVDKILVWDTGSTDKTVEIVKTINSKKIEFKEVGKVDKYQFSKMRQQMLEQSDCDWILVLDGDEIWWEGSIKKVIDKIEKDGEKLEAIVVPFYNAVGDIYHHQPQEAGKYQLLGKRGHLTIKAISKSIPGLHVGGEYGVEGYRDNKNNPIQERNAEKIVFIDAPFLHCTHLKRSSQDDHDKFKYELGQTISDNFKFPEVFYKKYPAIIASPWERLRGPGLIKAKLLTPLRRIKRSLGE